MNELLSCVEIGPTNATAAVVWMHGLGASGHDFESVVPHLRCPHVRFVFPHAPTRPVTINGGVVMPAWYDILSLDHEEGREHAPDIRVSATQIEALLERERARGVTPERTVLAGFSQGAAMALYAGARHAHTLAGIMSLSGYHVLRSTFSAERTQAAAQTEVLFAHGIHDPMVQLAWGREAKDDFAQWSSAAVHWYEYPMAHELCMEEVEQIAQWLGARVPSA